ncbi:probable serine/threonine-protein kinase pats1 [Mytilus trossulus]|uniref:probable serine/threonine-protein kinase pats1 n=1 Tax=Mytilus trossulus TaxID=6551 RepID=UPI0030078FBF
MDKRIAAIKDGTEIRRYVRIQVIGKEGVGKSSLVRRLVGNSNMKVNSTDGIDIVTKCKIRTTDGKWVIGKVETERDKIMKRIQETVRKEPKQSEPVNSEGIPCDGDNTEKEANISKQEHKSPTKDRIRIASPGTNTVEPSLTGENKVNIGHNVTIVEKKSETDIPNENVGVLSKDIKKADDLVKTDDMMKTITEQMDKILLKIKKDQNKMTSESLVECGLWDFAGQKDYYATHQTFLNPHAIYLLVTNISDDISATGDETDFDSIEEYIDFWFDSIHCLSTSSPEKKTNIPKGYPKHRLYPPVIVVCTHIDEYKPHKLEMRKKEYINRFQGIFGGQDKANHNRGIHFISNTESFELDCKKLKDTIYEVAKETMFFEEALPTQWIQLENALSVLKHESKQNILSFQNIVELSQITFIGKEQLLPFLTYQHKIGNIIFFEDINEYIILQPEWLVKCFRCLVCDDHEFKRNHAIVNSTNWQHLEKTGQLSDDIIDRLFEKEPELEFGKYKTHILNVMEKFDILVKPKFKDTKDNSSSIPDSYYMPCMIKQQSTSLDSIRNMFEGENCRFSCSPWLILEFKFLPLAYFNHILFYYFTRYEVCEKKAQKTLYRGKTLVNLDKTGLRKLCICFSKNAIALQVWTLSDVDDNINRTILEELCKKIEELKERLRQSISYDIKAKCSKGDYSNKEGRMTFEELGEKCENGHYVCSEHNERHSKDDLEKTWLQHADIVMAKLNTEQAEKNPQNSIGN